MLKDKSDRSGPSCWQHLEAYGAEMAVYQAGGRVRKGVRQDVADALRDVSRHSTECA